MSDTPESRERAAASKLEFEDALAAYGDLVPPRDAIPSVREAETGAAPEGFEFEPAPPPPELQRPSLTRMLIDNYKLLDPRGIAEPGQRTPLVVLSLLATIGSVDNLTFGAVLFLIKGDFELDFQFLLTLGAILGVVGTIVGPLGGYVADRFSRVWMIRIGGLVDSLATIAAGLAPGPGALVAARVVGGLGPAISAPAAPPLFADYFPIEKRARVYGFQAIVGQIWNLFSIFLVLGVVFYLGVPWRVMLITTGGIATVVALAAFKLKEPVRGEVDRLTMGASADAAKIEQKPVSWAEAWRISASIGTLRKQWYATPFLNVGGGGLGLFVFFAIQEKIALGEVQTGITDPRFILILPLILVFVPSLLGFITTPIATAVADRLLQRKPGRIMYLQGVLILAQVIAVVSILIIPNFWIAFAINLAIGIPASLVGPARGLLMSVVIPARVRGQAFQTIAPWTLVGLVILPAMGAIADQYGATTAAFMMVPIMAVGAAILMSSGADVERDIRAALAATAAADESRASRARNANKMIVARDVDVEYEGTQVLFGVDFDVEEGELVALLGTNGAGKSTLLRAISGIQQASNGAIFLDGEDITHKPAHLNARDGIVFLPGGRAVFPSLTVKENLEAAAWLYRDEADYVRARTDEVLEFFPVLRERIDTMAGNMSGGEQQMLALGQAFLMKPRLLMIDELSLGLAPSIVERLLDIVRAIHAQGTTVILVEQSVSVALLVAERAVFMERGEIRFDGPAKELVGRPDLVRAIFLGGTSSGFVSLGRAKRGYGEEPERVLDVAGVAVSYGGVKALSGATLHVMAGEIVGIIGPNGAGKTTLFDVISGFTPADEGTVSIHGIDATGLSPDARSRIGLARSFQDTRLFPSLTVRESIAVALDQKVEARSAALAAIWAPNVRRAERRVARRVEHLIDLLGLDDYANKFINELSTGSRRMVDLACVMAAEPKILLLDEPSSGMAQGEIEVLGPVVQRLARESGCGVLVIEHDMPLVTQMSDRLVTMELGRVIATGTPEEVMADSRVITSYLSASESVINRSGDLFTKAMTALGMAPDGSPADEDAPAARVGEDR